MEQTKEPNNPGWQMLKRSTASLKQTLNAGLKNEGRSIPEKIFVQNFLPWLCGEVSDTQGNYLRNWIMIAGRRTNPVHVVDEQNNVLFDVPSLCDRDRIRLENQKDKSIEYIVERTAEQAELSANLASARFVKEVGPKFIDEQNDTPTQAWIDAWKAVFIRYGKDVEKLFSPIGQQKSQEQTKTAVDEDPFDYSDAI